MAVKLISILTLDFEPRIAEPFSNRKTSKQRLAQKAQSFSITIFQLENGSAIRGPKSDVRDERIEINVTSKWILFYCKQYNSICPSRLLLIIIDLHMSEKVICFFQYKKQFVSKWTQNQSFWFLSAHQGKKPSSKAHK